MSIPDIAIAFAIAILYPLFFRKLADVVTDKKKVDELCGGKYMYSFDEESKKDPCLKDKKEQQKRVNTQHFAILLSAGLVGLAFSYYVGNTSSILGLGIGSVFTILDASTSYWEYMDEKMKLMMVGFSLGALLLSPKFVSKFMNKTQ